MKATINGILYEGTEEEIMRVVDRMTPRIETNPYIPRKQGTSDAEWMRDISKTISGQTVIVGTTTSKVKGCPNAGSPCFCTGACQTLSTYQERSRLEVLSQSEIDALLLELCRDAI